MSTRKVNVRDNWRRGEAAAQRAENRREEAFTKAKREKDKVQGPDNDMSLQGYFEDYASKMGGFDYRDEISDSARRKQDGENNRTVRAKGKKSRKDIRQQLERIQALAQSKHFEDKPEQVYPDVASSQHLERAAKIAQKALVGG